MNIVFLNGSPKPSGGNSAIFSEFLKKAIAKIKPDVNFTLLNIRTNMLVEADYELFETCDALVIAYPLYMDALPSHLTAQLIRLDEWFNSRKARSRRQRTGLSFTDFVTAVFMKVNGRLFLSICSKSGAKNAA